MTQPAMAAVMGALRPPAMVVAGEALAHSADMGGSAPRCWLCTDMAMFQPCSRYDDRGYGGGGAGGAGYGGGYDDRCAPA